jgi:hypothetical protein
MKKIFLFLIYILASSSLAFVENTTKGYANCMACHVSPNGGGILTDYGRGLSTELMSTWKVINGFEKPFYGAINNTKNVKFGGQLRTIQVYAENDQVKAKKQFVMQNNLEFALKHYRAEIIAAIGRKEGPKETPGKGEFISERHYVLWETSSDTRLRVGKFRQHFGINHPNHTRFVKNSLGFGSNSEAYNFEFSRYYEWGEINTSVSIGDFFADIEENESKRNFAFNFTHYMEGNSRIGFSYLTGKSDINKRNIYGLNLVHSFIKNMILRSEIDLEEKSVISNNTYQEKTNGLYGDHQVGYKLFKGGLAYLIYEHAQEDLSESETQIKSPGVGVQLLPIPHVEFQFEYQKRKYESDPENPEHRSFLTFHLYH